MTTYDNISQDIFKESYINFVFMIVLNNICGW